MREAIELARGGLESVSPNPLVGAVIVRNGRVIGQGYHQRFGGPHAEVEAIHSVLGDASGSKAQAALRGADVYVSLEPCGFQGKTPPCSRALVDAGVARVFYSAADPNPATRGKGPREMRRQGIEVRGGLLLRQGLELNAPYFHWRRSGRPWVLLKWAMSLDGKIATVAGESKWITGTLTRACSHGLRRRVDAIVVGTATAAADDPLLTARPARRRKPLRVVLDRRGRLPLSLRLFDEDTKRAGAGPRLCVVGKTVSARRRRELESRGVETLVSPEARGRFKLEPLLEALARRDVSQLLVEGGGQLAGEFVSQGLVDEVAAFIAPRVLGGSDAPSAVGGAGLAALGEALRLDRVEQERIGDDLVVRGIVSRG